MSSPTLIQALLNCSSHEEMHEFLTDILTPNERQEFQQRLDIAYRLYTKQQYTEIENATGTSSTTIARVAKCLHREQSWYRHIFEKLS